MKHLTGILCFLFLIPLSPIEVSARENQKTKQEIIKKAKKLESVEKEIETKKQELVIIEKKEGSILTSLDEIERELAKKEDELTKIENSLKDLKIKIDAADRRIFELVREKEKLSNLLKRRVASMYKMRESGVMRILFSSHSFNDLSRRYKYINIIIDSDMELLDRYNENQKTLETEKEKLENMHSDMLSLKNSVEAKKKEVAAEKGRRLAFLNSIRKEKGVHLSAIKELERTSKDLQTFIDELKKKQEKEKAAAKEKTDTAHDSTPFPSTGFGAMKGKLLMPVSGKVVSLYGKVEHPKFHTVTFNNGIEIDAPLGTDVKSVYKGKVIYSGWLKGYGRIIILDHGDGFYTLYAHLSKVLKELDNVVENGETIAEVGDTGSLEGARLYFEVRYKGVPKDPLTWLAHNK